METAQLIRDRLGGGKPHRESRTGTIRAYLVVPNVKPRT
jgi:hypothetical protein